MESKKILKKYTIIESYPSILTTSIPIIDIIVGIGYYIWLFSYFLYSFFKHLLKGPKYFKQFILSFFSKKEEIIGFPKNEIDHDIKDETILDLKPIIEDTNETKVDIYRGKKATERLKEVIREHNLYDYVKFLPVNYFTLREEILIGEFSKNDIILSKGYSIPVYNYISFILKIKNKFKK